MDDKYYRDMIVEALNMKSPLDRGDFDRLLLKKLPDILNESQKKNKITNLLRKLREQGLIYADNHKKWHISNKRDDE